MAEYKTEKRRAEVGEHILVTDADNEYEHYVKDNYDNGDDLKVTKVTSSGVIADEKRMDGRFALPVFLFHYEYEVIID